LAIKAYPEADLIYSDEDEIDGQKKHGAPFFKSRWDPELLLYRNNVGHLWMARSSSLKRWGVSRLPVGTDDEWLLLLRAAAHVPGNHVQHLRSILFSRAAKTNLESNKKVVAEHLAEIQSEAKMVDLPNGAWRIEWPLPSPAASVSIIVPTRNRADLL